jgi:predicted ATP-grasp superfamily ATP-dependent carboligase
MCNIELGYAADGGLSLIEVNGRTSATAAQNRLVGANLFAILLRASSGNLNSYKFSSPATYRIYSIYREGQ